MKPIPIFITTAILVSFFSSLSAQSEQKVDEFIQRVDAYVVEAFEGSGKLEIPRKISKRKAKVTTQKDADGREIIHKIKHYKGGLKKEVIKIVYDRFEKRYVIAEIVKLNDEYFTIVFRKYSDDRNSPKKLQVENLIDGRLYRKINYNEKGAVANTEVFRIN